MTQPEVIATQSSDESNAATLSGIGAIGLWSSLAFLTASSGSVPPFQLAAMTFATAGALGASTWLVRREAPRALLQPPVVWLLGTAGLFGYHALYFFALRLAPPAEAGLVSYLWPLLIVLFASFLPGERLRAASVAGALLGLAGVTVLVAGREGGLGLDPRHAPGYALALCAAVVWASYSVLSRRFGHVPTDCVVGFCLATAALSAACHAAFETTVLPAGGAEWLAVAALGIGPVGAAFYLWDIGMKKGDIRLLGVASYAAPVLSTLLLVAGGYATPSWSLGAAAALIVAGAAIASRR